MRDIAPLPARSAAMPNAPAVTTTTTDNPQPTAAFTFTCALPSAAADAASTSSTRRESVSSTAYSQYRSPPDDTQTSSDGELLEGEASSSEDDFTTLSDVESAVLSGSDAAAADDEGDEVDKSLSDVLASPRTPKRTKRLREQSEDEDGDDEAEADNVLGTDRKGKGKSVEKKYKFARKLSPLPKSQQFLPAMASYGSLGGITQGVHAMHAHSTVTVMNVQVHHNYPRHPDAHAHNADTKPTGNLHVPPNRRLKSRDDKKRQRKLRAQVNRPSVSYDPFVHLPVFQNLPKGTTPLGATATETSLMDISGAYDSDASMKSAPEDSDVDMNSASFNAPKLSPGFLRTAGQRLCYQPNLPLSKVQLAAAGLQLMSPDKSAIHRRPRHKDFPVREAGAQGTSSLRRTSPTSLLPQRRVGARPPRSRLTIPYASVIEAIRPGAVRGTPGRTPVVPIMCAGAFIAMLRARRHAREQRREMVKAHNAQTRDGGWRRWVGNYGYREWIPAVDAWWLRGVESGVPVPAPASPVQPVQQHQSEDPPQPQSQAPVTPPRDSNLVVRMRKRSRESTAEPSNAGDATAEREHHLRRRTVEPEEPYAATALRRQRALAAARRTRIAAEEAAEAERRLRAQARIAELEQQAQAARREAELQAAARRLEEEEMERISREIEYAEEERARQVQRAPSPTATDVSVRSAPPEYEPPAAPLGGQPSSVLAPTAPIYPGLPHVRHIPARPRPRTPPRRPEELPDYIRERWTMESPPPPPPYNAHTDREVVIAAQFVDAGDAERQHAGEETYEFGGRRGRRAPRVASHGHAGTSLAREPEPSLPNIVGAFPAAQSQAPAQRIYAPVPVRPVAHAARTFEAALDAEDGWDVEEEIGGEEEEEAPRQEGIFQRVFGMVWGRRG
ncbi:hypothetical protein IAT38_001675 [Cryptococcus sp. DSM 104549]